MTGRLASFAAPVALLLAVACDSPTGALGRGEAYELKSVGGDPVPAVVSHNDHATSVILADTLRFFWDGRGLEVRHHEVTYAHDPATPDVSRTESRFGYVTVDGRVEITYVCPPNALCVAGPHLVGRIDGRVMRLEARMGEQVNEQVYERVS